jgi:hypothetical protein
MVENLGRRRYERRKLRLLRTSAYANLNATEPDSRSRQHTTICSSTENQSLNYRHSPKVARVAVNSRLSMRNPQASVVQLVAADKQVVLTSAGFIGCSQRLRRLVLKHTQSWRRQTVSITASTQLFAEQSRYRADVQLCIRDVLPSSLQ